MNDVAATPQDDLTSDLANLRKDMAHMSDTLAKLVLRQAHYTATQASSVVSGVVNDCSEQYTASISAVRDRIQEASGNVEAQIERHPLAAMAIAAGVGLLIGASVLGRR